MINDYLDLNQKSNEIHLDLNKELVNVIDDKKDQLCELFNVMITNT